MTGNLWLTIADWLGAAMAGCAGALYAILPHADTTAFQPIYNGVREFFAWAMAINSVLPIQELLWAFATYYVIRALMLSGGLARRIYSLFSGGGGA